MRSFGRQAKPDYLLQRAREPTHREEVEVSDYNVFIGAEYELERPTDDCKPGYTKLQKSDGTWVCRQELISRPFEPLFPADPTNIIPAPEERELAVKVVEHVFGQVDGVDGPVALDRGWMCDPLLRPFEEAPMRIVKGFHVLHRGRRIAC